MSGESAALALAIAAGAAGALAVERDGAMAVVLVLHPGALAHRMAREQLLAVAQEHGIRNLAVELVDDDSATPRLPRD